MVQIPCLYPGKRGIREYIKRRKQMKIIFDTEKRTITEKAKSGDRQIPELKMTEEKLNMFATATAAAPISSASSSTFERSTLGDLEVLDDGWVLL